MISVTKQRRIDVYGKDHICFGQAFTQILLDKHAARRDPFDRLRKVG